MTDINKELETKSESVFKRFASSLAQIHPAAAGAIVAAVIMPTTFFASAMNILEHKDILASQGPEALAAFMKHKPDTMLEAIGQALAGTSPSKWQSMQTLSLMALSTLPIMTTAGVHLAQQFSSMKRQIQELKTNSSYSASAGASRDPALPSGATRDPHKGPLSAQFNASLESMATKLDNRNQPTIKPGPKGPRL
ncbi:Uncharacterised protein [Pseudomonas luteola]|uniref:Uncharacterized protein n=1 Tax=Pseudomonas luteola TaxID=47886 RepID=A0A2X2CIS3_PSELU|nr:MULTISPECIES: hypothetical protein [Pseudomonas]MBA1250259.1 hypothetical protein [Pseudomonas zeshuii]MBH3441782.1 hypothetical protein [Pseudomonas luteola]SPY99879.1 Uncharacterised protein [Pseudomonas luteola]SPZ00055.1 Uncharacterised protein [Pseudomonas luteola]